MTISNQHSFPQPLLHHQSNLPLQAVLIPSATSLHGPSVLIWLLPSSTKNFHGLALSALLQNLEVHRGSTIRHVPGAIHLRAAVVCSWKPLPVALRMGPTQTSMNTQTNCMICTPPADPLAFLPNVSPRSRTRNLPTTILLIPIVPAHEQDNHPDPGTAPPAALATIPTPAPTPATTSLATMTQTLPRPLPAPSPTSKSSTTPVVPSPALYLPPALTHRPTPTPANVIAAAVAAHVTPVHAPASPHDQNSARSASKCTLRTTTTRGTL